MQERPSGRVHNASRSVVSGPRGARHAMFAVGSVLSVAGVYFFLRTPYTMFGVSMASGYVGLLVLSIVLVVGPWNVLWGRANPVSTDLRRDLGIWAGVLGLIHVVTGLQVHFRGRMWLYFLDPSGRPQHIPLRHDLFGLANLAGLGATLVLLMLLALSNDLSLRGLGARRWKSLQRWNYAYLALVIAHTAAYQVVTERARLFVAVSAVMVCAVIVAQMAGIRLNVLRTRRSAAREPSAAAIAR